MTSYDYETRVVGDAFAGLSTAESDAFLTAYNAARNDSERAAVIRRHLVKPGTVPQARTSSSGRSQALNAGKWEMLAGKMHPKVDTEIDAETRAMTEKRRKLAAMRWTS